ncbi:hypothetical protein HY972_02885, partial [Candidatus Kaiserbacteria bacterium]|nr:hypothetical protein [Candidatus Kaiserbacteria bacterium]MBI5405957.1 hypothetical protein [Candidatus Kaiserbacteria bacterium]
GTVTQTYPDSITTQTTYVLSCTSNGGAVTTASQIVNITQVFQEF